MRPCRGRVSLTIVCMLMPSAVDIPIAVHTNEILLESPRSIGAQYDVTITRRCEDD